MLSRLLVTCRQVSSEVRWGVGHLQAGRAAWLSLIVWFRVLKLRPAFVSEREYVLSVKDIGTVTLRRNRGDIQSFREVIIDECYTLPSDISPANLCDIGSNIGLTSLWFARRYPLRDILVVEPSPGNMRMTLRNLRQNGVDATFVSAAIAAYDGQAAFEESVESNLGRLVVSGGQQVDTVRGERLAEMLGGRIGVVKLDIEGGEGAVLLEAPPTWLTAVDFLIAEFHPDRVDYAACVASIESQGLTYRPAGSLWPTSMDMFERVAG